MKSAACPWGVRPHNLDIAWARFPYERTGGRPAGDLHPIVILQVDQDGPLYWVACAMGTTNLKIAKRDQIDAIVMNADELAAMGLRCATRFDLDKLMWLPWNDEYIVAVGTDKTNPVHAKGTEALRTDLSESFRIRRHRGLFAPDPKVGVPRLPPYAPDALQPPHAPAKLSQDD